MRPKRTILWISSLVDLFVYSTPVQLAPHYCFQWPSSAGNSHQTCASLFGSPNHLGQTDVFVIANSTYKALPISCTCNFALVQFKENICLQIGFLCVFFLLSILRSFYIRGGHVIRYSCEAPLHVILTVVKDRQGSILGFLFREKGHKIMISPIVW